MAADKTSQQYYEDFLKSFRQYQSLVEPFKTKKSQHQAFQSVTTQAELLGVSQELLKAEIKAISDYTHFVKTYLAEATQILNYQENYLYVKLDDEVTFLKLSEQKASSLSSLAEANSLAKDLETHYQRITQMAYQTKSIVEIASAQKIFTNLGVEREKLEKYLSEQDQQGSQFLAAKEKLSALETETKEIKENLSQAESLKRGFGSSGGKNLAEKIRTEIDEALSKIKQVLTGYQNIVFSLK